MRIHLNIVCKLLSLSLGGAKIGTDEKEKNKSKMGKSIWSPSSRKYLYDWSF